MKPSDLELKTTFVSPASLSDVSHFKETPATIISNKMDKGVMKKPIFNDDITGHALCCVSWSEEGSILASIMSLYDIYRGVLEKILKS